MKKSFFLSAFALTVLSLHAATVTVTPSEDTSLIKITGCGFQSFGQAASDDNSLSKAGIPSGSAYFRWMWKELEPGDGQVNFSLIDNTLAAAHACGQTLELRIMNEMDGSEPYAVPQWAIDKGMPMRHTTCEGDHYSPDLDNATAKFYVFRLLRALGNRYDDHPDLGSVDVGEIGLWGEGHIYCDKGLMPSESTQKEIIDSVFAAFPHTPLTIGQDIGDPDVQPYDLVTYAVNKGRCGWRADCWGTDFGTDDFMPRYQATNDKAPNAWRQGPVNLESCGVMSDWNLSLIDSCFSMTLRWHTSMAENKSSTIPSSIVEKTRAVTKKLGFRLVLRKASYEGSVRPGAAIAVAMDWENLGVAPPYRDVRVAFRLKNNGQTSAAVITSQSIKGWLPGATSAMATYTIPSTITEATYTLETALVFHSAIDRVTAIAIKDKTSDGWYQLGSLTVDRNASVIGRSGRAVSSKSRLLVRMPSGSTTGIYVPALSTGKNKFSLYSINGMRSDGVSYGNGIASDIHSAPGVVLLDCDRGSGRSLSRIIVVR